MEEEYFEEGENIKVVPIKKKGFFKRLGEKEEEFRKWRIERAQKKAEVLEAHARLAAARAKKRKYETAYRPRPMPPRQQPRRNPDNLINFLGVAPKPKRKKRIRKRDSYAMW